MPPTGTISLSVMGRQGLEREFVNPREHRRAEPGPAIACAIVSTDGVVPQPLSGMPPANGHRWIELLDGSDRWLFDATFLLSGHRCIYGDGCPSIDVEVDPTGALGCCIHGAHLVDDDDRADVEAAMELLDDDNWQFRRRAERKGSPFKRNKSGELVTRKVKGACIFLNREDFPGGAGCSLHRAALEHGKRPLDLKPDVCWQVPIRLDVHVDDNELETVFVRAWDRRDWGPGGDDFHWWCIEESDAYCASSAVYRTSEDELRELIGDGLYDRLVVELEALARSTPVTLSPTR